MYKWVKFDALLHGLLETLLSHSDGIPRVMNSAALRLRVSKVSVSRAFLHRRVAQWTENILTRKHLSQESQITHALI